MADIQFTISADKIQEMLLGDRGMEVLTEELLNQLLQAEMTEHIGAAPNEQSAGHRGYRNGSYRRTFTTRIGIFDLLAKAVKPSAEQPRFPL